MKILIIKNTDPQLPYLTITPDHIAAIQQIDKNAQIVAIDEISPELSRHIADAEVIFTSVKYSSGFEGAQKLKWIHVPSAGIDNLPIGLKEKGYFITNASGAHPIPIAEYVIGTMLLLSKHFLPYYQQQQKADWNKNLTSIQPEELYQKNITIVGVGRIGTQIAAMAKAFGMQVAGVVKEISKAREHVDTLYSTGQLHEAVKEADFVVNILPLTKETSGLYDRQFFISMKESAYFINVGRGKSVDENALLGALTSKKIRGAALDVVTTEPLPASSPLWKLNNVFITPHVSSNTSQYMERVVAIFCENLKAYQQGQLLPNLVDLERGY